MELRMLGKAGNAGRMQHVRPVPKQLRIGQGSIGLLSKLALVVSQTLLLLSCNHDLMISEFGSTRGVRGGERQWPHTGVDFRGNEGDDILASTDGVVADVIVTTHGAGNCVLVRHASNMKSIKIYYTSYCHLATTRVHPGQIVLRGDTLGSCGHTGETSMNVTHLHFTMCTIPCISGTPDGDFHGVIDPSPFFVGCFSVGHAYGESTKPQLTYPISCK